MASVTIQEDEEGDYAGQPRNRIVGYYSPGEKEPSIEDEDGTTSTAKATPRTKPAATEDEPSPSGKRGPGRPSNAEKAAKVESGNGAAKEEQKAEAKAEAKAEKPAAEKMFTCPDCKQDVPKSAFSAHMDGHE
jgi:hypothetical protein